MFHRLRLLIPGVVASLLIAGCASAPVSKMPKQPAAAQAPVVTGIPACDSYLSSYLACHRAAGLFPPAQLPARLEAMRSVLLRDSQDPTVRPHLATRCHSLTNQLQRALQGKSCVENPPAASSQP